MAVTEVELEVLAGDSGAIADAVDLKPPLETLRSHPCNRFETIVRDMPQAERARLVSLRGLDRDLAVGELDLDVVAGEERQLALRPLNGDRAGR